MNLKIENKNNIYCLFRCVLGKAHLGGLPGHLHELTSSVGEFVHDQEAPLGELFQGRTSKAVNIF